MLKVPNKNARNLLELANLIEGVDPSEFDMRSWQTCICGHYLKSKGAIHVGAHDWEQVAEQLGLSVDRASDLFAPTDDNGHCMLHTPKEAAERIRRFAFAMVD